MRSTTRVAVLAAVLVVGLSACSSGNGSSGSDESDGSDRAGAAATDAGSPTSVGPATTLPPAATETTTTGIGGETTAAPATTVVVTTTAPPVPLTDVAVALTSVTDLDRPIVLAPRSGDDAFYIGERGGVVRAVSDERGDVVLDISDRTTTESERGLLGLAFSPDGTRLYVSSTDTAGNSLLEEYLVDADGVADVTTRRTVLTVDQPYRNHNGGNIAFGPDGYLYYGLGDGGSGGDPERRSLDVSTPLGKLLRIDPTTPSDDVGYTVPADNPMIGVDGARPEIWSTGLRNPWRFSFDATTGDLWIGDVGQGSWEEVDLATAASGGGRGVSFGWSAYEGTHRFNDDQPVDGHVPPVLEYPHGPECSITGGFVYRGTSIPGLVGAYVYGDYCSGRIWAVRVADGAVTEQAEVGSVDNLVSFGEDAARELYALSLDGPVLRFDPA
ncbi:MAG: sorbosone dehydrogenase family protein [Acidimicrobiia bacterium]